MSQNKGNTAPDWSTILVDAVAHTNGNAQGYARDRQIAISPIAFMPHRTLFHELAHVVLGHTQEGVSLVDGEETTPRDVREVEAECVALICGQSLGLGGDEFSRGYIQHWLSGNTIAERSVQRVFKSADAILKAGTPPELRTASAAEANVSEPMAARP